MNDNNEIVTTEDDLRAAINKSIEKRLDVALEKISKIEGMVMGVQMVIVEWQEAYGSYALALGESPEARTAARERLRLAEEAMLKL